MKDSGYKWALLVFLFVAFFLELGTRQLYNAVLPQISVEFGRFGVKRPRIRLEVSAIGLLLCIAPMLWVAKAGSFPSCCAALASLGVTVGIYEAAHYPAMFDCIAPRYRSAATGLTGCMAFLMGSFAPAVLGWMNDHLSMRTGFASLGLFYLVGAIMLVPAIFRYFAGDYVRESVLAEAGANECGMEKRK